MNNHYAQLYSSYQWFVPAQFNIAQACLHRWAENTHEGRRCAIYIVEDKSSQNEAWSYSRLAESSCRLANGLVRMGVQRGDRIAVAMSQRPEAVVALMAIFSVGAIALPLSATLGADQIEARLRHAGARVALTDTTTGPDLLQAHLNYPELAQVVGLGFQHDSIIPWRTLLARQPGSFKPVLTGATDPALLIYNDSLQAPLKGSLLSHSALIGNLPGFVASQNWFPKMAGRFWSPADWMSAQGLLAALLPVLYFGRTVVAVLGQFSGTKALDILSHHQVTHSYFPATTFAQLAAQANATPPDNLHALALQASGTHSLEMARWCEKNLGLAPNLVCSTPETGLILGHSQQQWPAKPGSMGRPYPGHQVCIIDTHGRPCAQNTVGELAVNRYDIHGHADPALFQCYWNDAGATQARFSGNWLRSGIPARIDHDGDYWLEEQDRKAIQ